MSDTDFRREKFEEIFPFGNLLYFDPDDDCYKAVGTHLADIAKHQNTAWRAWKCALLSQRTEQVKERDGNLQRINDLENTVAAHNMAFAHNNDYVAELVEALTEYVAHDEAYEEAYLDGMEPNEESDFYKRYRKGQKALASPAPDTSNEI